MGDSVPYPGVSGKAGTAGLGDLQAFRARFYDCLPARADALFELTDAVLCSPGPVTTLVDLSLCPEHRRGHGALYEVQYVKGDFGSWRLYLDNWQTGSATYLPVTTHGGSTAFANPTFTTTDLADLMDRLDRHRPEISTDPAQPRAA